MITASTLENHNAGLIERQVCLVLGAGGIGQNVAMTSLGEINQQTRLFEWVL